MLLFFQYKLGFVNFLPVSLLTRRFKKSEFWALILSKYGQLLFLQLIKRGMK